MSSQISNPVDLTSYDVILVNTSAGKDSQAMLDALVRLADEQGCDRSKFVAVHADLGKVEWEGVPELAREQAEHYGLRFEIVTRPQGDLLQQIEDRGMFPSSTARYCTSDQKTGQVTKLMTRLVTEQVTAGHDLTVRPVRILNCLGLRAQESPARAKKVPFGRDTASNGKRHVDRWLPIFDWVAREDIHGDEPDDVWTTILASGVRYHWAYDEGMRRLSCSFCVLSGERDLILAARLRPDMAQEYVELEERIGHTFRHNLSMADIVARAEQSDAQEAAQETAAA